MDDHEIVADFIDRVVREARIPGAGKRDELRRELESHFADAVSSPEAVQAAMERFGSAASVSAELERAHRGSRLLAHALRLFVATAASAIVALILQLIANLRIDLRSDALRLGAGFPRSIVFSGMIILAVIAAWELDIDSLCGRLERHPLRMLLVVLALAVGMLLFHAAESTVLPPPGFAIGASAIAIVIWSCTLAILARTDRAFARVFTRPRQ